MKSGIGLIDSNTIDTTKLLCTENYGECFYSVFLDKSTILKKDLVNFIENKNDIIKLILFDNVIYNKDRNAGNLLVTIGKNPELYIIDHTHVFKNEAMWDSNCFKYAIKDLDYKDSEIMRNNSYIYSMLAIVINRKELESLLEKEIKSFKELWCKKINLDEILYKDIPTKWGINKKNIDSLKKYLCYRVEHLSEIGEIIIREVNSYEI